MIGMFAAEKTLVSLGCNAALPETIHFNSPPKAACHLENINFLARLSCFSYHQPFSLYGLYFKPKFTAQKKRIFLIPAKVSPFKIILSYIFSYKRGTAVIIFGFIS